MDKWKAIAIIGIWFGLGLCGIGVGLGAEAIGVAGFIGLKSVAIAAGVGTFIVVFYG